MATLVLATVDAEAKPYSLQWDANIDGATAGYVVYYGTAPGTYQPAAGIDVGNTTRFQVDLVPGQKYYFAVRAYDSRWQLGPKSTELAFVVPADLGAATITSPANGATAFNTTNNIVWTAVAGAQAYYLYVGTTAGAYNVINSGETTKTQYSAASLPPNTQLYATLWTKINNSWLSTTSAFRTSPHANWIYPTAGAVGVTSGQSLTWTAVPGATSYRVWVGTTSNGADVVNSGEITQTQYKATLPATRTLYATIWSKVSNVWYGRQITFATSPATRWLSPASPGTALLAGTALQWAPVAGAQAYYLWIGTAFDAQNVVNSGETTATQWSTASLPQGQLLYATIRVKYSGTWWASRTTFTILPSAATFLSPSGWTLTAGTPIKWTSVVGAQAYLLWVGTAPGTNNRVNTGSILTTSYPSTGLPRGVPLYATIWTKYAGIWRSTARSFTIP